MSPRNFGFRRVSPGSLFNMTIAAGVGAVSGYYIFKPTLERLQEHLKEEQLKEQQQASGQQQPQMQQQPQQQQQAAGLANNSKPHE